MDNLSSPVQILAPTIPNSWCPSGDWAAIFNSYNQLFLNNSTVNIPYLNQVTPQQIQTINQNILNLQNQISAFAGQSGTISSPVAGLNTVTFATPMPTSTYQILAYFVSASGTTSAVGSTYSIIANSQTTTGFSIVLPTVTNYTAVNWSVFSIPTS
jgi:hypothetical protein